MARPKEEREAGATWQPLHPNTHPAEARLAIDLHTLSPEQRVTLLNDLYDTPRHRPKLLDAPAVPSRILPGKYGCKVSKEYRLRDCLVERLPSGHTVLEAKEGLIPIRGVLYDDGSVVRFEGWPTERHPFRCFACQDRCVLRPSECHCDPGSIERTRSCLQQPVHGLLRGRGKNWRGVLRFYDYYDKAIPTDLLPANSRYEDHNNQFVIELRGR